MNQDSYLNPSNDILKLPTSDGKLEMKFTLYSSLGESLGLYLKDTASYPMSGASVRMENTLDEAYLELAPSDSLFFTIGKQNITDGVGYAWNPTDFLGRGDDTSQSSDAREEREEREGILSLRGECFLPRLTVTFVGSPRTDSWGQKADSRLLLKFYTLMGDFDFSLSGYAQEGRRAKFGLNLSGTPGESLELHAEVALQRESYRYYVSEVAPGSYEFIQKKKESTELYPRVLVGGQYTFPDSTNVVLEYYHSQEGYNPSEWGEYLECLKLSGERYEDDPLYLSYLLMGNAYLDLTNMRQNYLFLRLSKPDILDLFEISSNNIYCLDDESSLMNLKVEYLGWENVSVYLVGNVFSGSPDSEFGMFHQSSSLGGGAEYFF